MFKVLTIATALALSAGVSANAAGLIGNAGTIAGESLVQKTGADLSGKERLYRLLRSHTRAGNPITQSVRDATGNPDIVVLDRRSGDYFGSYSCSYITLQGERALLCS